MEPSETVTQQPEEPNIEIDGSAVKRKRKYIIITSIALCLLFTLILTAVITILTRTTSNTTTTTSSSSYTEETQTVFGVNIYSTDQNFNPDMITDLITNKQIYNFRSFASWGRGTSVTDILNTYSSSGTSLLLNIGWSDDPQSFVSLFSGYSFDIKIQIDSCSWPSCWNPTEGGFCQGNYDIDDYISRLELCDSIFDTDIEFVIPWQNAYAAAECDYESVMQKALSIQQTNGRRFSLSGTFYNFFHGPDIGDGVFPSDSINALYQSVQDEAEKYASGLSLGLRVVETAWPDQCDSGEDKGYGAASLSGLCRYYSESVEWTPDNNGDVMIYWWIIDDRDVGDGCGYGAWGLYDSNGDFKC